MKNSLLTALVAVGLTTGSLATAGQEPVQENSSEEAQASDLDRALILLQEAKDLQDKGENTQEKVAEIIRNIDVDRAQTQAELARLKALQVFLDGVEYAKNDPKRATVVGTLSAAEAAVIFGPIRKSVKSGRLGNILRLSQTKKAMTPRGQSIQVMRGRVSRGLRFAVRNSGLTAAAIGLPMLTDSAYEVAFVLDKEDYEKMVKDSEAEIQRLESELQSKDAQDDI